MTTKTTARRTRNATTPVQAPAPATPTPAAPAAPTAVACGCGCGAMANIGRQYRPGHDARHAGQVGRIIAENAEITPEQEGALIASLPTPALQAKAAAFVQKRRTEAKIKAAKAALRAELKAQFDAQVAAL